MQRELGLPVRWLSPDEVDAVNPTLAPGVTLGASYCAEDGYISPPRNVAAYTAALEAHVRSLVAHPSPASVRFHVLAGKTRRATQLTPLARLSVSRGARFAVTLRNAQIAGRYIRVVAVRGARSRQSVTLHVTRRP